MELCLGLMFPGLAVMVHCPACQLKLLPTGLWPIVCSPLSPGYMLSIHESHQCTSLCLKGILTKENLWQVDKRVMHPEKNGASVTEVLHRTSDFGVTKFMFSPSDNCLSAQREFYSGGANLTGSLWVCMPDS